MLNRLYILSQFNPTTKIKAFLEIYPPSSLDYKVPQWSPHTSFDQKWGKKCNYETLLLADLVFRSWLPVSQEGRAGTFLYYTQESNEQKLHPSIFGVA